MLSTVPDGAGGYVFDPATLTGTLNVSEGAVLELSGAGIDYEAAFWDSDRSFVAFSAQSVTGSGVLALAPTGVSPGGGTWSLESGTQEVTLRWTAIPEPTAVALLPAGLLSLLARRRRWS